MRALALFAVLFGLGAPVRAAAVEASTDVFKGDPVFRAMKDEMDRTLKKLELAGFPKPYFVSYAVRDEEHNSVAADFGGLVEVSSSPVRQAAVILRVGDYALDDANFIGYRGDCRPVREEVPVEDDYDAMRFQLWSMTDQAYKQALECFAAKKAYLETKNIVHEEDDFSREKPVESFENAPEIKVDAAAWAGTVRRLSASFRSHPEAQSSEVSLEAVPRKMRYVNSEGTAYARPEPLAEFSVSAKAQAADGMEISDERTLLAPDARDFSPERLSAEVDAFAGEVKSWVQASTAGAYVGPVIFEDQAAGEFFHHLLAEQVSAPRAPLQEDEERKIFDGGGLAGRLGLRVASPILSVTDDPSMESFEGTPLFGHYTIDDEGVPASKVALVQKGMLRDVLMSRAPTAKRPHSNGHGRGGLWAIPSGQVGVMVVRSDETVSKKKLVSRMLSLCREQGLEYGLRIKHLYSPAYDRDKSLLPLPVEVYKVYVKDGHEERVRGIQFEDLGLRALKDVLAASKETYVYNFYARGPYRDNVFYVPASIVTPSILVQEIEFKPVEEKALHLPYLPHPYFEPQDRKR